MFAVPIVDQRPSTVIVFECTIACWYSLISTPSRNNSP